MLQPLRARGVVPSEELLRSIERDTKQEFDAMMESQSAVDHGFWQMFYSRLLRDLGIQADGVCADLVARTRTSANWCEIRPGTRESLLRLRERFRLAVISNADGKIADILSRCGIADCFETITDSGIVGKEKPHPAIFEAALSSMRVAPQDSLYIGDVYSVDYLGATRVGMQGMLFDVAGAHKDNGCARLESLEVLESLLKV